MSPDPEAPSLAGGGRCLHHGRMSLARWLLYQIGSVSRFTGKKVKMTTYAVIYARRPHNGLETKSFQINQTRRAVEDSPCCSSCSTLAQMCAFLPQPPRVNLCSSTGPFVGPPATYQLVLNLTHCKTYRRDIEGGKIIH